VHLCFPYGPFNSAVHGARLFWRNHLRRLKYHNPALPISVEHGPGNLRSPMTLSLTFEGADVDALKAIPKDIEISGKLSEEERRREQLRDLAKEGWLTEKEKEELARKQSPNWRDAPREGMTAEEEREAEAADLETLADLSKGSTTGNDEVVLKEPQPEVSVNANANAGEQPPRPPIYTRSVTVGVKDRTASQIWNWFKMQTNCTDVPRSAEDDNEYRQLARVFSQSAMDRRRVKKGVDERKANDEMLKRARGEVEKLRAEA
jgi:Mitochondrial ribosomal protein L51 / S25 / CI-B8 domain